MQARVRRSNAFPSGLEYHALTPKGMTKYLEQQRNAPDHLKDLFFLDEGHRSITDYLPGLGTGPNAPSQTQGIFVSDAPDPKDQERCTAFNAFTTSEQMLESDRPIGTIQVTRFSDATLVTCSVSHVIGDLFTVKSMFKAWETTLHGKPLTPDEGLDFDPFTVYGPGGQHADHNVMSNSVPLPPGWRVYGALDKARLVSRFLWDCHVSRPEKTISPKYIFIPDAEVKGLQEQAARDLVEVEERRKKEGIRVDGPLKLSRSNVLYAWLLKHNHTNLSPSQVSSPITISNARVSPPAGMRAGSSHFPKHEWYGSSAVVALPSMKVGDIMAMSLGELALRVREGTQEGSTPENMRRWFAHALNHTLWKKPSGQVALWCAPDHWISGMSDWRLIRLPDWDATPARLDGSDKPVSSCGVNTHMVCPGTQRNRWVCLGDAAGGVWMAGNASDAEWRDPRGFGKYPHLARRTRNRTSKL